MWQNSKGKCREETLNMITTERQRIINTTITSYTTIMKPPVKKLIYIENTFSYNHMKKAYIIHKQDGFDF